MEVGLAILAVVLVWVALTHENSIPEENKIADLAEGVSYSGSLQVVLFLLIIGFGGLLLTGG